MKLNESLKDSIMIVTGGGRGIGAGISRVLGASGAHVIIFHPENEAFDEFASTTSVINEIAANGGKATSYCVDVGDKKQIDAGIAHVIQDFGRIDGLINNAGICEFTPFFDIQPEVWHRHLNVNLNGPFFLSQAAGRAMKAQGKGAIVNISTVSAFRGGNEQVHYISSKGGLNSLTTSMAHELRGFNIRVNAILVGGVATDINDEQRAHYAKQNPSVVDTYKGVRNLGLPEDLGNAARYLLSDESSWVTGSLVAVDGGALIS
jgi:NAD(P)-dependent dehydrogenase (short-subunit alcohol dehydrogenase family)